MNPNNPKYWSSRGIAPPPTSSADEYDDDDASNDGDDGEGIDAPASPPPSATVPSNHWSLDAKADIEGGGAPMSDPGFVLPANDDWKSRGVHVHVPFRIRQPERLPPKPVARDGGAGVRASKSAPNLSRWSSWYATARQTALGLAMVIAAIVLLRRRRSVPAVHARVARNPRLRPVPML